MRYRIKAHPTMYSDVLFRSRLEARWAAFFDLAGWQWEYEPVDIDGWSPDFLVTFPCGHSECGGSHTILVEVKPYFSMVDFRNHPCMTFPYGGGEYDEETDTFEPGIPADASAAFGANPSVTYWEMSHGSGGGEENVERWCDNWQQLWKKAGAVVMYRPPTIRSVQP